MSKETLTDIALDIYFVGHWTCDRISEKEAATLFKRLRDVLKVAPGEKLVHLTMGE